MKKVEMYTDGACSYNPGPGGYGIVLKYGDITKQFSGFCAEATNNQMELKAVIEGIKKLKEKCNLTIYTDSAYVFNAFSLKWIDNWIIKNWKTSANKPVLNKEYWTELYSLVKQHKVKWVKVKGHSDNFYNNICDELARNEIKNNIKKD